MNKVTILKFVLNTLKVNLKQEWGTRVVLRRFITLCMVRLGFIGGVLYCVEPQVYSNEGTSLLQGLEMVRKMISKGIFASKIVK